MNWVKVTPETMPVEGQKALWLKNVGSWAHPLIVYAAIDEAGEIDCGSFFGTPADFDWVCVVTPPDDIAPPADAEGTR